MMITNRKHVEDLFTIDLEHIRQPLFELFVRMAAAPTCDEDVLRAVALMTNGKEVSVSYMREHELIAVSLDDGESVTFELAYLTDVPSEESSEPLGDAEMNRLLSLLS